MIDLAKHYVSRGWPVFPLAPGGKVPAIPKDCGGHGCLDATLDMSRVEQWWEQHPEANVGIATGRRSGILVIDVDKRTSPRWLESVQELALPQTFTVRTWSGGWHLYFALPAASRITIGANLLPGIDWRGNGGYVVAPGSIVEGVVYQIARNVPIVSAPAALLERIEARSRMARPEPDTDGHYVIRAGRRNETLFALGCLMRRFGCEFNVIVQALSAASAEQCEPPLAEHEVRQIAASAMRYAPTATPKGAA